MNVQPAEHCGNISPGPLGYRSECVLRPGHSGSHANETGGRWWRTTAEIPAPTDSPLRQQLREAIWTAGRPVDENALTAVLEVVLGHGKVLGDQLRDTEATVQRVTVLYEQWVKAGPPPLGTSMSRWWDARLVELHNAILPPDDRTPAHNASPSIREAAANDRRWWNGEKTGE